MGKKGWGSLKYNGLNGIDVECQDRWTRVTGKIARRKEKDVWVYKMSISNLLLALW